MDKKCTSCGVYKNITFYHRSGNIYHAKCKKCRSGISRKYYLKNRNIIILKNRLYREIFPERVRSSQKKYNNQGHIKDRRKIYRMDYYLKNKESLLKYALMYRTKNKDIVNHKISEYMKTKKGTELRRKKSLKRRAYYMNIIIHGTHTEEEWLEVIKKYKYQCVYCGEIKRITRDHIIPISKGGSDKIENIQPLCLVCNARKGARIDA